MHLCVCVCICLSWYVCNNNAAITKTAIQGEEGRGLGGGGENDQFIGMMTRKKSLSWTPFSFINITSILTPPPPHPFLPCLQEDAPPHKLSQVDDVWNCTGRQWPEFRVHLQCNSYLQCAGGEDEAECRYRRCHQTGVRVQVADKCYMLGRPHAPLSWIQASHTCQLHGGYLASVRSSEHIDYLKNFFRYLGWRTVHMFIGLQTASLSLPDMWEYSYWYTFVSFWCLQMQKCVWQKAVIWYSDQKRY